MKQAPWLVVGWVLGCAACDVLASPAGATGARAPAPPARDVESEWASGLDLRRHEILDAVELGRDCRDNLAAARLLLTRADGEQLAAQQMEIVVRFSHPAFAPCKRQLPELQPFVDATEQALLKTTAIVHGSWVAAATCKVPNVLLLGVGGQVTERGVMGETVIGQTHTVESYDLEHHINGWQLKPKVRDRNVVTDRDDQLAVFDDGVVMNVGQRARSSMVLAACEGKTTTTRINMPRKPLPALKLRAIAIGSAEGWEWTAFARGGRTR